MGLLWNPIMPSLRKKVSSGARLRACISAFCTSTAVEELLDLCEDREVYFITRWRVNEIATGVSDLNVYHLLKQHGVPLYINYSLHSKLYRFSDGHVLCGSCNATSAGLGLMNEGNIETGYFAPSTTMRDEFEFKRLRDSSICVDHEIYQRFKTMSEEYVLDRRINDNDRLIYESILREQGFLLSDLPATRSPELLLNAINDSTNMQEAQLIDCVNYGVTENMTCKDAADQLRNGFMRKPFIELIVAEIRSYGSMRFGAVSRFIHDQCRDVPSPYRSDVKTRVSTLYNWLEYFFDDLSWDVPGSRSQVIRSTR